MTPLSILIAVCMFITAIANSVVGATSTLPADGIASSSLRPAHGEKPSHSVFIYIHIIWSNEC